MTKRFYEGLKGEADYKDVKGMFLDIGKTFVRWKGSLFSFYVNQNYNRRYKVMKRFKILV